ncbi:cyanophycin synthetase [uncultured Clostridium sp.]|uniref:cyanophycin synthetase n=1 Tax=uncultured Clostridium sp. TaxID=59620 RepID=UPI0028E85A3A|nr:cyanophycin synthetase [uncultured Clostridium sp.]
MKILNHKYYSGRNIYCHRPCIKMEIDLEGFKDVPSKDIDGFNEKLIQLLPILKEHRCGIDEEMGFVKRLYEGTYLAHICEHICISLQDMIGLKGGYGKAREIEGDIYFIIYEAEYEKTAIEIGKIAVIIINSLISNKEINIEEAIYKLREVLKLEQLGPSTVAIIREAKNRKIPYIRIGEGSIFQLGYGSTSRMVEATISAKTCGLAIDIACDKLLTKEVLYNQCLPVAEGSQVINPVQMLMEAGRIGYPVVLKPRFGNQGKGVFVNLRNERELMQAYNSILEDYKDIIIEKHVVGKDFRVCVVNYEVVAVSERVPPYVVGDGVTTIIGLIHKLNEDSRRGDDHEKPLTRVKINKELINYIWKNSYSLDSIPKKGEKVTLRENANLSTGGVAIDCTDIICEENIEICKRIAKTVGLDICGIDICCTDISKTIDGAIIEVNAAPGIRMHEHPYEGESRNVGGAIVDMLFKEIPKQIPVISITGTNGKTTTARLISYVLSLAGYRTGLTTTGGIYINNQCIDKGDTTGYDSAMTVLTNSEVEVAVLETARGGIIRKGLAYDLADVGIITNITSDHLGIDNIDTLEELAFVKSLVVEAVKDDGYAILNANDHISITLLNRIKGNVILFSKDENNSTLIEHMKNGGYGIYLSNDFIYVEKDKNISPIIKVKDIKITLDGKLEYNIENAMAACAALISLGVDYSVIRKGLQSFYLDEVHNPGRFNLYKLNDSTVVLDYAHNIEGYKAVIDGIKKLDYKRLIGIIGVPGDRKDEDIIKLGEIAGENFEYIYIKEDSDKRCRKEGEVASLLKKGVIKSGIDERNIKIILEEKQALKKAIEECRKGDLIIIFFENYEPLLEIVKKEIKQSNNKSGEALA